MGNDAEKGYYKVGQGEWSRLCERVANLERLILGGVTVRGPVDSAAFASQKCSCNSVCRAHQLPPKPREEGCMLQQQAESRNGELSAAERSEQKPSAAPTFSEYPAGLTDRQSKPSWPPTPNAFWDWDEAAGQWYCAPLLVHRKTDKQAGVELPKGSASKAGAKTESVDIPGPGPQSLWEAWGMEALWHPERRQWVWPSELRKDGYGVAANGSASKAGDDTSITTRSEYLAEDSERERAAYLRGFQDAKKLLANVAPAGYVMVKQPDNFLWVNVYKHPTDGSFDACSTYDTREMADKRAASNRIACVRVWFSEGQFDE